MKHIKISLKLKRCGCIDSKRNNLNQLGKPFIIGSYLTTFRTVFIEKIVSSLKQNKSCSVLGNLVQIHDTQIRHAF